MTHLDHDRCSELLAAYVRGELTERDRSWVSSHLSSCAECSAELVALEHLTGLPDARLNDIEKGTLHRRLDEATAVERELDAPRTTPPPVPIRGRVAQWLGAAALIALVAVGITVVGNGMGGSDDSETAGETSGGDEDAGGTEPEGDLFQAPESQPRARAQKDTAGGGGGSEAAGDSSRSSDLSARIGPRLYPGSQTFDEDSIVRWGASNLELVLFAEAYDTSDAGEIQDRYLNDLVRAVGQRRSKAEAETLRECSSPVIDERDSSVPAYAAYGRYEKDPAVVVGFAWSRDGGPLNRYMLWVWPAGRCDAVLDYREGRIRPSP